MYCRRFRLRALPETISSYYLVVYVYAIVLTNGNFDLFAVYERRPRDFARSIFTRDPLRLHLLETE